MNLLRRLILIGACSAAMGAASAADPARGTKDEAKALAEAAAAHVNKVGSEQAFKDFADAKWHPKDMYVFAQSMDGVMIYHGANEKLVGKNFNDVKDSTGKEFNKEMIAAAKKGAGWVDYQWVHPATKKIEDKTSYVVRINKPEGFVGVGIYR
ncbi:cache domain-containing protein [Roseateles sp. P5_E1]